MALAEETFDLKALARSRSAEDRERLMMGVARLCESAQAARPQEMQAAQPELAELFMSLVVQAERDVRARLAQRIASAAWAPQTLVNLLAFDEIEIARPVIASSPLLRDEDLLQLLAQATIEHQIEVARRPGINAPVVEAILDGDEGVVLAALAGNETAQILPDAMLRLVEASRRNPSLRSPLARHPRLSPDQAERLYAWVGESLKAAIASRFKIDPRQLEAAVADTVRDLSDGGTQPGTAADEREAMEQRLVDKLHEARQLRPGYLMRALRDGRFSLFQHAVAKLAGVDVHLVRKAILSETPDALAFACLAARLDRSAFPTLLHLVRQLSAGRPAGGDATLRRAMTLFGAYTPAEAPELLRRAVGA